MKGGVEGDDGGHRRLAGLVYIARLKCRHEPLLGLGRGHEDEPERLAVEGRRCHAEGLVEADQQGLLDGPVGPRVEGAALQKELVEGGGESVRHGGLHDGCAVGARGRLYAHRSQRKQGNSREQPCVAKPVAETF